MGFRIGTAVVLLALIAPASSAQQDREPIRVATRLVEVNVIARDRDGRPVTDLTRADFRLLENGKEQPIEFYEVAADPMTSMRTDPEPAATGTFSNRVAAPGATVTVLLIDRLNTTAVDQVAVREHALKFLEQLKPEDRVAIYVLDDKDYLRVLHDFTNDTRSLLRALRRYGPRTSNQVATVEDVLDTSVADSSLSPELLAWIKEVETDNANSQLRDRAMHTNFGFETIARHLSGVRGRKNLVWISSGFPISITNRSGTPSSLAPEVNIGLRELNEANIAVYPVDARRLIGAFASPASAKQQTFTTLSTVRGVTDVMELIADETGGRAYFNTNDLQGAIRRAIDDSRVSYVLGYYPSHNKWDGQFRQIRVQVTRRGVDVRHRKGYIASAAPIRDEPSRREALRRAVYNPLEATAVALAAQLARPRNTAPSSLDVTVRIDPRTITLERTGDRWTGELDLVIAQSLPGAAPTLSLSTTLSLNLTAEQRDRLLRQGLAVTRTIAIHEAAHQLRVVARDVVTGAIGSLSVSGSALRDAMQR